jgi:hypothetical protein
VQTRRRSDDAVRPVGTDHEIGVDAASVGAENRRVGHTVDDAVQFLGSAFESGVAECSVEARTWDGEHGGGIRDSGKAREPRAASRRPYNDHVAALESRGGTQAQLVEDGNPFRPDQISAGLVAWERGLVDKRHTGAGARQDERSDGSGRARAHDDGVVASAGDE